MTRATLIAGAAVLTFASLTFGNEPTLVNSVGMEFILVLPEEMQVGVFRPGCPEVGVGGWSQEDVENCLRMVAEQTSDGERVEIAAPYYLGKFEVTQGQWREVMGENPSAFRSTDGSMDNNPVESITFAQAQAFVAALNAREETDAYHIPSEFEWEYACRAGGPGQQDWSEIREMSVDAGESLGLGFGRTPRDPNLPPPTTFRVGTKVANDWGFHDMLGNVWEWTADWFDGRTLASAQPADSGETHVLKGAGFVSDVKNAICATRGGGPGNGWDVGLRIAKAVPAGE